MGLRLRAGIDAEIFAARTGVALLDVLDHKALEQLQRLGFLAFDGHHLQATGKGRLLTNYILGQLLA